MNSSRPVNLNLIAVSWPVTAIASITHRISAVIVWIGAGFLMAALWFATASEAGFQTIADLLAGNFLAQFVAWGLLTATGYYCFGTIKHVLQDLGYFETFSGGKAISWTALVLGVIVSIASGVLIWA